MLVRVAGDVIMISPPLIISASEIDFVRPQNSKTDVVWFELVGIHYHMAPLGHLGGLVANCLFSMLVWETETENCV